LIAFGVKTIDKKNHIQVYSKNKLEGFNWYQWKYNEN